MAIYQNKVFLIGYLGADPTTHTFEGGGMVTNASLATTRSWKKRGTEDWQEETTWHRLVFYGGEAIKAFDQIRKGTRLSIEGYIRSRMVGDGADKKYYTDIIIDRWINLDPKVAQAGPEASEGYRGHDHRTPEPDRQYPPQTPSTTPPDKVDLLDDDDDSLPF